MISDQQFDAYQADGYLVVENLIPNETLKMLRDRISEIVRAASEANNRPLAGIQVLQEDSIASGAGTTARRAPLRKLAHLAFNDEWFRSVAASPEILDIAAKLSGNAKRLMLYSDQAFLKPAFEGSEKPLHQDNSYFRMSPSDAGVTCWIAVDDSTLDNGCMNYIPGSHKLGLLPHKSIAASHLVPDVNFKLNVEVAVPIPAGSAIFHHLLCLHSSKANTSPNSRRAWAIHYANRDAESPVKKWEEMIQLR
jgi:phytanoyl-CoA hydroxylase